MRHDKYHNDHLSLDSGVWQERGEGLDDTEKLFKDGNIKPILGSDFQASLKVNECVEVLFYLFRENLVCNNYWIVHFFENFQIVIEKHQQNYTLRLQFNNLNACIERPIMLWNLTGDYNDNYILR